MEIEWANLKAHELRRLAEQDAIVILPVGAIEQHGPHLPVQVDSRLGGEVARAAARIVAKTQPVVVTPVLWCGLSDHHIPFGGTLSLDYDTWYRVLRRLVNCLVEQGFRRICIANSHGGNVAASKVAVADLTTEFKIPIVTTGYFHEAEKEFAALLVRQKGTQHACEAETSMMLQFEPGLVDTSQLAKIAGPKTQGISEISANGAYRWYSFAHRTHNGVIGDPTLSSAEKGKKLTKAAAEAVAKLLLNPHTWADFVDLRAKETGGIALRQSKRGGKPRPYKALKANGKETPLTGRSGLL